MILTGVSTRIVPFSYYNAALADTATYVTTVNGMMSGVNGSTPTSGFKIEISGDGTNWGGSGSWAGTPVAVFVSCANRVRVKNGSGGPVVIHLAGWYIP